MIDNKQSRRFIQRERGYAILNKVQGPQDNADHESDANKKTREGEYFMLKSWKSVHNPLKCRHQSQLKEALQGQMSMKSPQGQIHHPHKKLETQGLPKG